MIPPGCNGFVITAIAPKIFQVKIAIRPCQLPQERLLLIHRIVKVRSPETLLLPPSIQKLHEVL
ncbi:hypothetical protein J0895_11300 [Phormidium pseudopriestleyi FRX01]|uniref:Uncharacterized protein n=1 Tax=Phormidium pseudopriestleyi FRX01 TaxID=1759528 RepID=A0ABS3FRE7_9CYAN|nr:hypothetical protein [Phormidium pseudopriestleyi]MBO0349683.1 hypothetical protein [Phormidium pseudopriestleyi FRX01]